MYALPVEYGAHILPRVECHAQVQSSAILRTRVNVRQYPRHQGLARIVVQSDVASAARRLLRELNVEAEGVALIQ